MGSSYERRSSVMAIFRQASPRYKTLRRHTNAPFGHGLTENALIERRGPPGPEPRAGRGGLDRRRRTGMRDEGHFDWMPIRGAPAEEHELPCIPA